MADHMHHARDDTSRMEFSHPVVVSVSAPGVSRWGYHQFPTLSRLPDGALIVTVNDGPDDDTHYGVPGPAFVSRDDCDSWSPYDGDEPMLAISHSVVSRVGDGEYLAVPMSPSPKVGSLPERAGTVDVYGEVAFYRLVDCEAAFCREFGRLPATRWTPSTGTWTPETIQWDTDDALVRIRSGTPVIPRPYLDNHVVNLNGTLLYADLHAAHLLPDGSIPANYACWCMESLDNGRTWRRRGLIAHDRTGTLMMGEPSLVVTSRGDLACVIRCAHHKQMPMLITYSPDAGRSWTTPEELHGFGVMPQTLLLGNGKLVLAFGRPGVWLMVSPDGSARTWSEAVPVIKGDPERHADHSCGYTRLVALDDETCLLAYSDLQHVDAGGNRRRAVLVRRVHVR